MYEMYRNAAILTVTSVLALAGPVALVGSVALAGSVALGESGPSRDGAKPDGPKPDGPKPDGPKPDGAKAEERIALFEDTSFRRGFHLAFPSSAKGRAVEKVLPGSDAAARPAWRLCQWATRISLAGAPRVLGPNGAVSYTDETKRVVLGGSAAGGPDLLLDLRAGAEYEGRVRAAGEAWPHLLVEQDAIRVIPVDRLARLELEVDLRLSAFADRMAGQADPGLHAAQLQLFLIVKEVAPGAPGDFLWFGVPFFDSRQDFPAPHRARDGGKDDATGKLIYTIDGREVLASPLGRGDRIAIRKDLLPAIREALAYGVEHRFLANGDPGRYAVVNMNLGWEMPGAFDAAVEIRGLAVTAVTTATAPTAPTAVLPPASAVPPPAGAATKGTEKSSPDGSGQGPARR